MKKNPLIYHEKIVHDLRDIVWFNNPDNQNRNVPSSPLFISLRKLHDLIWNSLYSKGYYFNYAKHKWEL